MFLMKNASKKYLGMSFLLTWQVVLEVVIVLHFCLTFIKVLVICCIYFVLPVFGSDCTGHAACSGDVHSLCKNNKCACADDYEEKNNVCTQSE